MKVIVVNDGLLEELLLSYRLVKSGVSCGHNGCLIHATHPCQGCGRILGQGDVLLNKLRKNTPVICPECKVPRQHIAYSKLEDKYRCIFCGTVWSATK